MGNKKLLLPGTSKIKFRRNPFVVFVYCLRYMCIPNSSFLALLASKLGYLWRINSFRFLGPQIIILNYNPLFFFFQGLRYMCILNLSSLPLFVVEIMGVSVFAIRLTWGFQEPMGRSPGVGGKSQQALNLVMGIHNLYTKYRENRFSRFSVKA